MDTDNNSHNTDTDKVQLTYYERHKTHCKQKAKNRARELATNAVKYVCDICKHQKPIKASYRFFHEHTQKHMKNTQQLSTHVHDTAVKC